MVEASTNTGFRFVIFLVSTFWPKFYILALEVFK